MSSVKREIAVSGGSVYLPSFSGRGDAALGTEDSAVIKLALSVGGHRRRPHHTHGCLISPVPVDGLFLPLRN